MSNTTPTSWVALGFSIAVLAMNVSVLLHVLHVQRPFKGTSGPHVETSYTHTNITFGTGEQKFNIKGGLWKFKVDGSDKVEVCLVPDNRPRERITWYEEAK